MFDHLFVLGLGGHQAQLFPCFMTVEPYLKIGYFCRFFINQKTYNFLRICEIFFEGQFLIIFQSFLFCFVFQTPYYLEASKSSSDTLITLRSLNVYQVECNISEHQKDISTNKIITVFNQPNENYNGLRYTTYIISSLIIAHVEQETLFPLFLP